LWRFETSKIRNITVAVDDEVCHRARIAASERSTSVNALVRDKLRTLTTTVISSEGVAAALAAHRSPR